MPDSAMYNKYQETWVPVAAKNHLLFSNMPCDKNKITHPIITLEYETKITEIYPKTTNTWTSQ